MAVSLSDDDVALVLNAARQIYPDLIPPPHAAPKSNGPLDNGLQTAIAAVGSVRKLAAAIGVKRQSVRQWKEFQLIAWSR